MKLPLGEPGKPLDKQNPFYFGFLVTAGALIAFTVLRALASASQVFLIIIVAFFLAAGLNPAVLILQKKGLDRKKSVAIIIATVLIFFVLLIWLVIPPAVTQISNFIKSLPNLVKELNRNHLFHSLDHKYGIVSSLQKNLNNVSLRNTFISHAFGGVIGVGKAVISLTFSILALTVLTLYFLITLPSLTKTIYGFIPKSRRERVSALSDEIIYRIGSFVGGQATVAIIAGIFITLLSLTLRIPYSFALGMVVLVCGLIPLIGHFLGITVVTLVALARSPITALIAFLAYLVYVQIENYLIMPKIMRKSLSIPGIVTILAAMLGTSLLGPIGGLLSVPIAAAVLLIVNEVVLPKSERS